MPKPHLHRRLPAPFVEDVLEAFNVALALSPAPDDRPVEPPVKVPFRGFGKNRKV